MLEKTIAHRGNLFAQPRKDLIFLHLGIFPPRHCKKVSGFIEIGEDCPKALVKIPVWRRGKSWKTHDWEHVCKQVIKDLWKNSLLEKRNIQENS
jgi:hypothetical protein